MATRAQKTAKCPYLYSLIGEGKEFNDSELPTLRDCLQYGLLLRERSVRNLQVRELCEQIALKVKSIWGSANPRIPLVTDKYAIDKLVHEWNSAKSLSKPKANKAAKEKFISKFDRLFDIAKCKCDILPCISSNCDGCETSAHVICTCPRENKIPTVELLFLSAQRNKDGEKSSMQIGNVDIKESKCQLKRLVRKEKEAESKKLKTVEEANTSNHSDISKDPMLLIDSDSKDQNVEFVENCSRNMLDISKVGLAAVRFGVSDRAAAAISTAALAAARDAGLIARDCDITIDRAKIRRSKMKICKRAQESDERKVAENKLEALLFDGRKDLTKYMKLGNDGKLYPSERKEDHYSLCSESGGKYLHHFTVSSEERSPDETAAHQIAESLYEWILDHDISDSLVAIGGDSTNVNTGWKGGVIKILEDKLGKKLIWLICALHTNELPLRHLMIELDGPTISDNKFCGNIGKLISKVTKLPVADHIPTVEVHGQLLKLSSDVKNSLSNDQRYLYEITWGICTGEFPDNLKDREIGPHSHARWLNLASRLCRLWCSQHGLCSEDQHNLKLLVQFVVGVYAPMWFEIKMKSKWTDGPYHVLKQLELVQKQTEKVKDIVIPYVKSSAWYAHSEMILQAMICSHEKAERVFAVKKILEIRGDSDVGNTSVRPRKTPRMNEDAKKLSELISWETNVYEPVLTCPLSKTQINTFRDNPMIVPDFPVHGQSIERVVKEVTRASQQVYGAEKRDGFIRATLAHRELLPSCESKKDMFSIVQ